MATQSRNSNIPKVYGPGGTKVAYCSFTPSGSTTAPTVNEAQGVTGVTRVSAGLFDIQLAATGVKAILPDLTLLSANGSTQSLNVVSKNLTTGVVRVQQTTSGGTTAVDTANTIDCTFTIRTRS